MSAATTLPATRRAQIVDMVRLQGTVRVADVAAAFGVSPVTARRDIALLARQGQVQQVRGGARGLRPGEERIEAAIGVVVPSLDYYWPAVVRGVNEAADAIGLRITLQGSNYTASEDLRQFEALADKGEVGGLIIAPDLTGERSDRLVAWLRRLPLPVVLVERRLDPQGPGERAFDSVVTDHAGGARAAVEYLYGLGHRRLGLLLDSHSPNSRHIRSGWLSACEQFGLDPRGFAQSSIATPADRDRSKELDSFVDGLVKRGATGVLAHSDTGAISLLEHLAKRGVRVPQDVSVVTYDDEIATLARPALTAVGPPKRWLGEMAVRLMVQRLRQPEFPTCRIAMRPELVVRDSTGPAPQA